MTKGLKMSCETIKYNMPSLLAGELSGDEHSRMLRHMAACSPCRAEMSALENAWVCMDRWRIEDPSPAVKARVMTVAKDELAAVQIPWWSALARSVVVQTALGALGISMIVYLVFPYDKIINLCEALISKSAFFAYFPAGLVYFALGLMYGLVPISLSEFCFSGRVEENPLVKGLGIGAVFAAFLIPFFIIQCPQFDAGLIFIMALGIITGALSGGTGTFWVLSRMRREIL
jgi:hypothetical protein